jgi:hypothetical protein
MFSLFWMSTCLRLLVYTTPRCGRQCILSYDFLAWEHRDVVALPWSRHKPLSDAGRVTPCIDDGSRARRPLVGWPYPCEHPLHFRWVKAHVDCAHASMMNLRMQQSNLNTLMFVRLIKAVPTLYTCPRLRIPNMLHRLDQITIQYNTMLAFLHHEAGCEVTLTCV